MVSVLWEGLMTPETDNELPFESVFIPNEIDMQDFYRHVYYYNDCPPPKKEPRWRMVWYSLRYRVADVLQSLAIKIGGESYDYWY